MRGLYIHIPFCKVKCPYCNFYKEIPKNEFEIENFLEVLKIELEENKNFYNTIFIGGGTPNILNDRQLINLFEAILNHVKLPENYEWTIELNPELVNINKLLIFKDYGINRLSLGVQSLKDEELKFFSRLHRKKDVYKKLELINKMGFENVNIDLIFGSPLQTLKDWENILKEIVNFPITHISTYLLTIEEGTPFEKLKIKLQDEETIEKMFLIRDEILESYGFYRYEISNYAKKGFECKHNLIYWKRENYIGIGPSASSFIKPNIRYKNPESIKLYIEDYKKYREIEILNEEQILLEKIYLSLRLSEGLEIENAEIFKEFEDYLYIENNRIRLKLKGILILDKLVIEIFSLALKFSKLR
ncbi:MAG: radical SAM family heme chaperone HemW [candidate division WOR-3 bacterium]